MCSCQWCVICARIPGGDSRVRVARSCIGPNPQARMVPGSGFHQCGVDRLKRGEVQWVDGEAKRRDLGACDSKTRDSGSVYLAGVTVGPELQSCQISPPGPPETSPPHPNQTRIRRARSSVRDRPHAYA